jgi:hypothetical protein
MNDFDFPDNAQTRLKKSSLPSHPNDKQPSVFPNVAPRPQNPVQQAQPEVREMNTSKPIMDDPKQDLDEKEVVDTDPSKPKYDPDELNRIFDAILFEGEYFENITIRGRLSIRFRTRTADEIDMITGILDKAQANLVSTLGEKRSIINLQYSLCGFNGKDLRGLSLEEKAKFVGKLPGPVISALLIELSKFDAKVYAACVEAEENF